MAASSSNPSRPADLTCAGLLPWIDDREDRLAVYDEAGEPHWTRGQLREQASSWASLLERTDRGLVFLWRQNDPGTLAAMLGALAAGHAVALLSATTPAASIERLIDLYAPEFVIHPEDQGQLSTASRYSRNIAKDNLVVAIADKAGEPIAEELAVLLSTSGTTGSEKFVRLSARNLTANADQIIAALGIGPDDVGVAHLPLHYSYGLSVITSHLRIGAAVHLCSNSVTVPEFWSGVSRAGATHFPGVPFHYDFIARSDLGKLAPATLKTFTQAGGALNLRLQRRMHELTSKLGARFFVMYGQTEAAPRITTLPHDDLPEKLGSVGKALVGGAIQVVDEQGDPVAPGSSGAIVYQGPNVMMGYAEARADLGLADVQLGRLETGDLGYVDADGYLYLTGRAKRVAKPYGLRISLDEVEQRFGVDASVAAIEQNERIVLFTTTPDIVRALTTSVSSEYKLPPSAFEVRELTDMPRKSNGKTDYAALGKLS